MSGFDYVSAAKRVLDTEVQALQHLERYFDKQFESNVVLSLCGKARCGHFFSLYGRQILRFFRKW